MATITASTKAVYYRGNMGRFATTLDKAASDTVRDLIELGARTSRGMAPAGKNRHQYAARPGYVPLKRSIRTSSVGTGKRGWWYSIAPHAQYVEEGTSAHVIKGKLRFTWKGGKFFWNNPKFGPVGSGKPYENWDSSGAWVYHPGTGAQPFLEPAYKKVVRRQAMDIAKKNYPGR